MAHARIEIKAYFPSTDAYFDYFDHHSTESIRTALTQLGTFVASEGPYDAVLAYSHGAALAATFLIEHFKLQPTVAPPFRCAIFLSGGIPLILGGEEGNNSVRFANRETDGVLLALPVANIWGQKDQLYPGMSEALNSLCNEKLGEVFVHDGGHEVPGVRAKDDVLGAVKAIRRTVDRALTLQ